MMKIGKSTVYIQVEGCIKCGTKWSSGWSVARVVPITIGKKAMSIDLNICADCREKENKNAELRRNQHVT